MIVNGISVSDDYWPNEPAQFFDVIDNWQGFCFRYKIDGINECILEYAEIVAWIKKHVADYPNNALWQLGDTATYIKLRNEKDAIFFALRWPER